MSQVLKQKKKKKSKLKERKKLKALQVEVLAPNYVEGFYTAYIPMNVRTKQVSTFNKLWKQYGKSKKYYCANWYLTDRYHYDLNPISDGRTPQTLDIYGTHTAWVDAKTGIVFVEHAGKIIFMDDVPKADPSYFSKPIQFCRNCGWFVYGENTFQKKNCPKCKDMLEHSKIEGYSGVDID